MDGNPTSSPSELKVRKLQCPNCGAAVTARGFGKTESLACESCRAVLDLTSPELTILQALVSRITIEPAIPLGTRGRIKGEAFEVIGYLQRKIVVDGVSYFWSEYVLFNPYKGFRWLSEYNGHWNYILTTHRVLRAADQVEYLGQTFKHFQSAMAEVSYVAGEFPWKVTVGEKGMVSDYVAPPLLLSSEQSGNEITWSIGEYMEPEAIAAAFRLKPETLPERVGVFANQPSPHGRAMPGLGKLAALFVLGALLIHFGFLTTAQNQLVYQNGFVFNGAAQEKSVVTGVFELTGRSSNVVVRSHAFVQNNWIYFGMALINSDTGTAYDFGREISFYSGVDSDGSWTEGGHDDEATIPSVPAGRYYLRIEPESSLASVQYSIEVYRDVPRWSYLLFAVAGLLLVPIVQIIRYTSFEGKRWSESDHSWSSGDDDDD